MSIKLYLKGIGLSVGIGIVSLLISSVAPLISSMLVGLLLGILIGNFIKLPESYSKGIQYTSGKMLEFSLLFLAIGINFNHITKIGAGSFIWLSLAVLAVLAFSLIYTRKFNNNNTGTYLVGFGTAICGSSAIAAISPSIANDKKDIAISLAVVNLIGTFGMLALPGILAYFEFSDLRSGFIIGGSLHSVANVAGAGFAMGDETARVAITIKLARVALLSPAMILYSYFIRKDAVSNWKEHFKLPWYVWSFVGISILATFIPIPAAYIQLSENIGKVILTIAMVAIGLKVSFKTLVQSGRNAMIFGILLFVLFILTLTVFSANM